MLSPDGLDPTLAVNLIESNGLESQGPEDVTEMMKHVRAEVLIELVPQNVRSGEPALQFHRAALEAGVHVITANKSPIALGYRDLRHRAARAGRQFRFEATVLDGLPLFRTISLMERTKVIKVRGVLNGTSSTVLETVGNGASRSRGLARAQAQGIAEADAVLDLDGWDAAAKAALLANVWMDGALRVVDVARAGIESLKDQAVQKAAEEGMRTRLVAHIERSDDGQVRASVEPVHLEPGDALYGLRGNQGGVVVTTDDGHQLTMIQGSAGLDDAAYGIMQDGWAILNGLPQV